MNHVAQIQARIINALRHRVDGPDHEGVTANVPTNPIGPMTAAEARLHALAPLPPGCRYVMNLDDFKGFRPHPPGATHAIVEIRPHDPW